MEYAIFCFVSKYIGLVLYLFITVLFDLGEDLLFENQDKQPKPKFFGSKFYLAWASSQHCVFTSFPKRISDNTLKEAAKYYYYGGPKRAKKIVFFFGGTFPLSCILRLP